MDISILLPTRGRSDALMSSIKSLYDLADDFSSIELLFGVDNDDLVGLENMLHNVIPWIEKNSVKHKIVIFERFGYHNLHKYVNGLAENSQGSWLFFWNDDAVMKTPGWDLANEGGQAAMIDLAYNLGGYWYKSWKQTAAALAAGDFDKAADGLKDSKWYEQVKGRAVKIVDMIRNGKKTGGDQKAQPVSIPPVPGNRVEQSSQQNAAMKDELNKGQGGGSTTVNNTTVNNQSQPARPGQRRDDSSPMDAAQRR
jgi:hypothetical protein